MNCVQTSVVHAPLQMLVSTDLVLSRCWW